MFQPEAPLFPEPVPAACPCISLFLFVRCGVPVFRYRSAAGSNYLDDLELIKCMIEIEVYPA
jgi:hypothetical protein